MPSATHCARQKGQTSSWPIAGRLLDLAGAAPPLIPGERGPDHRADAVLGDQPGQPLRGNPGQCQVVQPDPFRQPAAASGRHDDASDERAEAGDERAVARERRVLAGVSRAEPFGGMHHQDGVPR
jgi:hypothetical protein